MGIPKEITEWFDSLPKPRKRPPAGPKGYGNPKMTDEEVDNLRRLIGVTELWNKKTHRYDPWP